MKTGSKQTVRIMAASSVVKYGMVYECWRYLDNGEIAHCDRHPKHLRPVTREEDLPKLQPMANIKLSDL